MDKILDSTISGDKNIYIPDQARELLWCNLFYFPVLNKENGGGKIANLLYSIFKRADYSLRIHSVMLRCRRKFSTRYFTNPSKHLADQICFGIS